MKTLKNNLIEFGTMFFRYVIVFGTSLTTFVSLIFLIKKIF